MYSLHPSTNNSAKTAVTALAARIDDFVGSILPNHIWHRDAFELKVVRDNTTSSNSKRISPKGSSENDDVESEKWMIEGYMRVGDSVDDEWLVVWILKEISKQWDVAISWVQSVIVIPNPCRIDQRRCISGFTILMVNSYSSRLPNSFHRG